MEGKEKEAVVKVRINQDKFREKLINKYKKCCLCNVNMNELLVASHIKPWSISDANEKLDITEENIKYIKYHRKNVFIEK